jgi:membrane protease YdiL (CAAX protease family)
MNVPGRPRRDKLYYNRLFRLVVFFVVLTILLAAQQVIPVWIAIHAAMQYRVAIVVTGMVMVIPLLLFVYSSLVRAFEKREVTELSARDAPGGLGSGTAIGVGLFSFVILVLWLLGVADIAVSTPITVPYAVLLGAASAAVGEELLVRGAIFRILEDSFGTWVALLVSAAIFGGLHAANPGATVFSACAVALEAGLLLALAYVATRSLWLPIGLHFGWDVAESALFGSTESGNNFTGILHTATAGPQILTGGAFGPEASIVAIAACAAAAAAFGIVAFRRGHWKRVARKISAAPEPLV